MNNELYHHGILGQRWGHRNGPPYPLGSSVSTGKRLKKQTIGERRAERRQAKAEEKSARYRKKMLYKAANEFSKRHFEKGVDYEIKAYNGDVDAAIKNRAAQVARCNQMIDFYDSRIKYNDEKYKNHEIDIRDHDVALMNYVHNQKLARRQAVNSGIVLTFLQDRKNNMKGR